MHLIGRGRYRSETYPSPPAAAGAIVPAFTYAEDSGSVLVPPSTPTFILTATLNIRAGSRVKAEGLVIALGQGTTPGALTNFSVAFDGDVSGGSWQTTIREDDVQTFSPWIVSGVFAVAGTITVKIIAFVNGSIPVLVFGSNPRQLLLTELLPP